MDDGSQRALFAGLAGLAALALVGAVVAWLLAVKNAGVWIIACLIILVMVIIAEVVLLILTRRKAQPFREPQPHKGPGADDEVMDFVIDDDSTPEKNPGAAR